MSAKLVRTNNQPIIKDLLNKKTTPKHDLTPKNSSDSVKKRTPPGAERPDAKKYQLSMDSITSPSSPRIKINEENDTPIDETFKGFSKEFVEFGKTIIENLRPMRENIESLLASQKQSTEKEKLCETVVFEQAELKQHCEAIETENKELKSRLSKLENKMLKNNLIIHGIHEDQWEQEVNRQEKIHKAIASTVDDKDSRKRMKIE